MIYTSAQIYDFQRKTLERNTIIEQITADIAGNHYSVLEACRLMSAFSFFPAKYGNCVESLLKKKLGLSKPINTQYGDATMYNAFGIEIKTSFTRTNGELGLRQIRFHKNIDYYILVNYDDFNRQINASAELFCDMPRLEDNMGKMHYYLVPRAEMQRLVEQFASYTHGTTEQLGVIVASDLQSIGAEYSLTYNAYTKTDNVRYRLWYQLQRFSTTEAGIVELLHQKYNETNRLFDL